MQVKTLGQFIIERQADFPYAKGELSRLLRDIGIAAKIVNRAVTKAGLVEILGETGDTNVHGEQVKNWMFMPMNNLLQHSKPVEKYAPLQVKKTTISFLFILKFLKTQNM